MKDIEKLGWLGDVVNVREGYARNYLIPSGLAVIPNEANVRAIADEKQKRAEQRIAERSRLEVAAKAVEGAEAVIAAKANELGHLFGSVGAAEIASNLREQGYEVANEIVKLPENIKEVGSSKATLKFADDLRVNVNVVVVAAGEGSDSLSTQEQEPETIEKTEDRTEQ